MTKPERDKLYREKNIDKRREYGRKYQKIYRVKNKEKCNKQSADWQKQNPDRAKNNRKNLYEKKRNIINDIKIKTGCQNPECKWIGDFEPCDLDFHHIDPNIKKGCIAILSSISLVNIHNEINKCIILCAICHRRVTHKKLDCDNWKK